MLESETASFEVAPAEWPLKMLIDAAVGYCEINLELDRHQLGLCDGHLGNCVQSGEARPVWVDLGSIVSVTSSDLRGVSEFCECLLHPLLLLQRGVPGRVIRALALALTHHLSITHKFPFAFIAKTLAGFTSNLLITEFMPDGLGRNEPSPNPLPDGYCLDGFLTALRGRFRFVETIPYPYPADFSKRTLIFCRGSLG